RRPLKLDRHSTKNGARNGFRADPAVLKFVQSAPDDEARGSSQRQDDLRVRSRRPAEAVVPHLLPCCHRQESAPLLLFETRCADLRRWTAGKVPPRQISDSLSPEYDPRARQCS